MTSRLDSDQGFFGLYHSVNPDGRGSSGIFKPKFQGENGSKCQKNNLGSYVRFINLLKPGKPCRPHRHFNGKNETESGLMIPRSGNFKGNFLLLAIKWRLRSSFYIANRYKFASFLFVCSFLSLFLRILWSHGSFTGKQLSRKAVVQKNVVLWKEKL